MLRTRTKHVYLALYYPIASRLKQDVAVPPVHVCERPRNGDRQLYFHWSLASHFEQGIRESRSVLSDSEWML